MYTWAVRFACLERAREREKEGRRSKSHTCMHARTQAYTGERERHLIELRGGKEEDFKRKKKVGFQ